MGGFNQRPTPYTRGDRFSGINRFSNNGRGRNRGDSLRHLSQDGYHRRIKSIILLSSSSYMYRATFCATIEHHDLPRISISDFDNGPWASGNNYGSRGGNMGMRGCMDMKGGNYRGSGDSWGGNSGVHSIHMRGLPFKATEQDIADVNFSINFRASNLQSF